MLYMAWLGGFIELGRRYRSMWVLQGEGGRKENAYPTVPVAQWGDTWVPLQKNHIANKMLR